MPAPKTPGLNHGYTLRQTINGPMAGRSLLDHLVQSFTHSDAETWRGRIERAEVQLDEARAEPDTVLEQGQVMAWIKPPWREPDAPLHFEILYEDRQLLAVAKPSGLPTLPGAGFQEHTLLALVRAHCPGANPMHRLGRGTSGVLLFTKDAAASREVQAQWRTPGAVTKLYRALVTGEPSADAFVVAAPIGPVPDAVLGQLHSATPTGKASLSRFEVVERRGSVSLVEVSIETGRPHQIRIHAAAGGHPLVGDPLYGPGGRRAPGSDARPGDLGYQLHAVRLALAHPITGEALEITAPAPEALQPKG